MARRRRPKKGRAIQPAQTDGAPDQTGHAVSPTRIDPSTATAPAPVKSEMPTEVYIDFRKCLVDIEQKNAELHDKTLANLSVGALGVSIAFLRYIVPDPMYWTQWILIAAWCLLVTSLIGILRSMLIAQEACRYQRDLLDEERLNEIIPDQTNEHSDDAIWWTKLSNRTFVGGVIALLGFCGFNMLLGRTEPAKDGQPLPKETMNAPATSRPETAADSPKEPGTTAASASHAKGNAAAEEDEVKSKEPKAMSDKPGKSSRGGRESSAPPPPRPTSPSERQNPSPPPKK